MEYETEQQSSGYISNFSGISVANAVIKIAKFCRFPFLIMNSTNRGVNNSKRQVILLKFLSPIEKRIKNFNDNLKQACVPEEFKSEIERLLKEIGICLLVMTKTWAGLILWRCIAILECMSL